MNEAIRPAATSSATSWKTFVTTYLPALVLGLGTGIVLPAVPALAKSFDVSFGVASGVVTAFLLGNLAGTIPTGWAIDRFGRRSVMIAGPLLTSLTALLVWYATSFSELLLLRFLGGWAAQMWSMGRLAAIASDVSASERGRQVSWMFGMDNTGALAGPLLGGYIASHWGTAAPFLAYAGVALIALAPTLMFADRLAPRAAAPAKRREAPVTMSLREIIVPRLKYFAVTLFAGLTRGPVSAGLMHLYAAFAYHLGPADIGWLATGAAFISWPIGFIAGWMMDRFGRKRTIVPGFAGVAVAMTLLAVSAYANLSYAWYVTLFFIAVATQALTGGSIQTLGADVAPAQARGKFLGFWRFTGQGGSAFGPILFALIAVNVNYETAFMFTASAAAIVSWIVAFHVPETRGRA